jgi:glycosyltransferase involved in cell wall biosynthesis
LVEPGRSGLVVEPTPAALAAAMREVIDSRDLAERMGTAGRTVAGRLTWPATVERLLLPVD